MTVAVDRDLEDRPVPGQRYRGALVLVFASVAPVTLSIFTIWNLLGAQHGGFGFGVMIVAGFLSITGPYVVGWIRSLLGLIGAAAAVLAISAAGWPGWLASVAGLAVVAAVVALVALSLRLGHVWRPADARPRGSVRSTLWPYPYA